MRAQTDTHTHTDRDDTGDLIICPMLCYSNGTDNYVFARQPTPAHQKRVKPPFAPINPYS